MASKEKQTNNTSKMMDNLKQQQCKQKEDPYQSKPKAPNAIFSNKNKAMKITTAAFSLKSQPEAIPNSWVNLRNISRKNRKTSSKSQWIQMTTSSKARKKDKTERIGNKIH